MITIREIILGLICLACPITAHASGFMVPELSASAMGKGSAIVTASDDPALIWYNPAGTAFLPGFSVTLGGLLGMAYVDFDPADGSPLQESVDKVYTLPRFFLDVGVTDWMHIGLGAYTAYGTGVAYEDDWYGRASSIKSEMQSLSFNPNVSFLVHPQLAVGFGFVAMKAGVNLVQGLPEAVGGRVQFGGEGWAFGGTAGVTFKAVPEVLDVGLSYRSRMKLPFDGRVDFDPSPDFARDLVDQKASTEIWTPDYITAGVGWNVTSGLHLALDLNVVLWNLYDETILTLEDGSELATINNYHVSVIARLGAEWKPDWAPGLALRAGFIFDQNPATDGNVSPTLPDANKLNFTLGVGQTFDWFRADLGYMFMWYLPNEASGQPATPDGTYKSVGHMLAFSVTALVE